MEDALMWAARIVLAGIVFCALSGLLDHNTWKDKLELLVAMLCTGFVLLFLAVLLMLAFPDGIPP